MMLLVMMFIYSKSGAQHYSLAELSTIKPSRLVIENYCKIKLPIDDSNDPMMNQFDPDNPYTYLQLLMDGNGKTYHLILQTDFSGKVLLLCYSNILAEVFNRKDRPIYFFQKCLKGINEHLSSVQAMDHAIQCMVDRLNNCAED